VGVEALLGQIDTGGKFLKVSILLDRTPQFDLPHNIPVDHACHWDLTTSINGHNGSSMVEIPLVCLYPEKIGQNRKKPGL
jgi:hypothetical protein